MSWLLRTLVPRPLCNWWNARFGDADEHDRWGYAVWSAMGIVVGVPEIWAAVDNKAPWPTISGTVGHLEYRWSWVGVLVLGLIVFAGFHAIYPRTRSGALATQADSRRLGRTEAGRFTKKPPANDERAEALSSLWLLAAVLIVIAGSAAAAALSNNRFVLAYVLYGLIGTLWIAVPSFLAYWFAKDVPFPTLFRTLADLEHRLHYTKRKSVAGVTNADLRHACWGSTRLSAANSALSAGVNCGRAT